VPSVFKSQELITVKKQIATVEMLEVRFYVNNNKTLVLLLLLFDWLLVAISREARLMARGRIMSFRARQSHLMDAIQRGVSVCPCLNAVCQLSSKRCRRRHCTSRFAVANACNDSKGPRRTWRSYMPPFVEYASDTDCKHSCWDRHDRSSRRVQWPTAQYAIRSRAPRHCLSLSINPSHSS